MFVPSVATDDQAGRHHAGIVVGERADATTRERVIDLDRRVLRERGVDYDVADGGARTGYRSIVDDDPRDAIGDLDAAVDRLARSTPAAIGDRELLDAYAEVERTRRRLDAQQARLLDEIRQRQAYVEQACVSVRGWLQHRLDLDPTLSMQRDRIAHRLHHFDQLRQAWQAGDIDGTVVHEICRAAIPQRREAIVAAEAALLLIGRHGRLNHLRNAIAKIRDVVDPDGTDTDEHIQRGAHDPRRDLRVSTIIDGLGEMRATLTQYTTELLHTLLDAYSEPDPPDTPEDRRRSPGQRRHDAFTKALRTALDLADDLPDRQGRRPHLALYCDLDTLLHRHSPCRCHHGHDGDTSETSEGGHDGHGPRLVERSQGAWLRFTGDCPHDLAREIALDAAVTPILGMGDWRPVAVGRTHRVAPAWLRHAIEWVHRTCRGPGCDRPTTWTQAAHTGLAWADGGETRLDEQMPGCTRHHQLIDLHGWQVHWDHTTNIVTWTSPDGQITAATRPPPKLE